MKFIVKQERFLKELTNVSKVIKSSLANPIDQFIKIDCNENGITLLATDEKTSIQTFIPVKEKDQTIIREIESGSILVKAIHLNECVKKLSSEFIFELIDDIAKIEDENTSYNLKTVPSDEFLDVDFSNEGQEIELPNKDFMELIDQTCFAASNGSKPNVQDFLKFLNIECKDNHLVFTATDSFKLAKKTIDYKVDSDFNVNIDANVAIEISKMLIGVNNIKIVLNSSKALFCSENTRIVTQTAVVKFPDTSRLIPEQYNYVLETNSRKLLDSIDRLIVSSAPSQCIVRMLISNDEVQFSSNIIDVGNTETRLSDIKFSGETIEILFQADYLLDTLKAIKATDVKLCFVERNKPFVVLNPKDNSIVMVLTPIRSQ